jgi:hypothetical protein
VHGLDATTAAALAGAHSSLTDRRPPTIDPLYGERRNLSIGRPMICARVRIDDGQMVVAGEPGWTLMSGCLDDPVWCAERLATFKTPARVEFVSEPPRAPVGKFQKLLIRAGAAHGAG